MSEQKSTSEPTVELQVKPPVLMKVHSLAINGPESRPLLLLKDEADTATLPIWLTPSEAGQMVSQSSAGKAQVMPEGLSFRMMNSLGIEIESCHLTHVEGHFQYGYLRLLNHPTHDQLPAKAGEMLPLVSFLEKPIWVFADFIRASKEIDLEFGQPEKEVEMLARGHRIKKPFFH